MAKVRRKRRSAASAEAFSRVANDPATLDFLLNQYLSQAQLLRSFGATANSSLRNATIDGLNKLGAYLTNLMQAEPAIALKVQAVFAQVQKLFA